MPQILSKPVSIWIAVTVAFVIPATFPSLDIYRGMISSILFVSMILIFYLVAYIIHRRREAEKNREEQEDQRLQTQTKNKSLPGANKYKEDDDHHGHSNSEREEVIDEEQPPVLAEVERQTTQGDQPASASPPTIPTFFPTQQRRIYFLDHVKTFVTVMVLAHHITIGFGGDGGWPLRVNASSNRFASILTSFFLLANQSYFMPCLYFVSAYFVPNSCRKKGVLVFLKERGKRLLLPSIIFTFGVTPFGTWIAYKAATTAGSSGSKGNINIDLGGFEYFPNVGTTWFLWWLLLFDAIYATTAFRQNDEMEQRQETYTTSSNHFLSKFPSNILCRWMFGGLFCGWLNWIVVEYVFHRSDIFAARPIPIFGSIVSDCLMFSMGVVAGANDWFSRRDESSCTIRDRLGVNIWLFRFLVICEYTFLGVISYVQIPSVDTKAEGWLVFLALCFVSGVFCVDCPLALLEFFQSNLDHHNAMTKWCSDAAYGAYLLQNVTVVLAIAVFAWSYDAELQFHVDDEGVVNSYFSETSLPTMTAVIWWLYTLAVWVPLTWILSWAMKRWIPGLKSIL